MVTGTMLTPDNIGSCKDPVLAALVEASPPDFNHFHVPQSCGRGAGLAVIYKKCENVRKWSVCNFKLFY